MKHWSRMLLVGCVVCAFWQHADAASLKVSPARFIVHDVEPGKLYDLYKETGVRLTIFNEDDVSRAWVLSTHRPSERGRWEVGYGEIPDARWCWFGESEVSVEANNAGHGHLFLQIPDEERYYNQHWIVTLHVGGKPEGMGVGLAVDIRVQIETKSKTDQAGAPHGSLGMKPSVVEFEDVPPGATESVTITLFNNSDREQTYTVASLFLDKKHEPKTYLTHSHSLLVNHEWIQHDRTVKVKPGRSAPLNVTVTVPDDAGHFGKKWEDCLLIKPEKGRAEFVRVRITTGPANPVPSTRGADP